MSSVSSRNMSSLKQLIKKYLFSPRSHWGARNPGDLHHAVQNNFEKSHVRTAVSNSTSQNGSVEGTRSSSFRRVLVATEGAMTDLWVFDAFWNHGSLQMSINPCAKHGDDCGDRRNEAKTWQSQIWLHRPVLAERARRPHQHRQQSLLVA